jgi:hypothetical protein
MRKSIQPGGHCLSYVGHGARTDADKTRRACYFSSGFRNGHLIRVDSPVLTLKHNATNLGNPSEASFDQQI